MEDSYVLEIRERQFSDLYMCYCGYARCRSLHSYGPAVRPNYIIHYILEGKGSYSVIEPGVLTFYQADQADPWTYLWVGFDGKRAAEYLRGMGLGENRLIYRSSRGESLETAVREMLRHNTYTAADQFVLEGLLYSFFGALSEELDVMSAREAEMGSLYVRKAVEFIQDNFCNPIHITDIADYVQRELSVSPKEYLANYRLTRASELLLITDLSVESVALSCGYSDPLVFSKSFKAKNGVTPTQYRKTRS